MSIFFRSSSLALLYNPIPPLRNREYKIVDHDISSKENIQAHTKTVSISYDCN
eukprot:m.37825 g.37825  ORF g.37825 m.37825 type:complete len:53 (+) comp10160_c0_seq3:70-228(+)